MPKPTWPLWPEPARHRVLSLLTAAQHYAEHNAHMLDEPMVQAIYANAIDVLRASDEMPATEIDAVIAVAENIAHDPARHRTETCPICRATMLESYLHAELTGEMCIPMHMCIVLEVRPE